MATSERRLREAEFRERRRQLLRSQGTVLVAFALGLGLAIGAKEMAPAAFDAAVAVFVLGGVVSLLAAWRTARRAWRCPACDVRWESSDSLASFHWNHCASCGAALQAIPEQRERERLALAEFALEGLPHDELVARFTRRRRLGLLAAGAVALAGLAALVWVHAQGFGEPVTQGVAALFVAVAAAAAVLGSRCPRCRGGVVAGKGGHCQRCGLSLGRDVPEARGHSGS